MMSRIVFLLTLATFFNPIAVMAMVGESKKPPALSIGCNRSAEKVLSEVANTSGVRVEANGTATKTTSNGG